MSEITVQIKKSGNGKVLVITMPLNEKLNAEAMSKSGKSYTVASTRGNKPAGVKVKGREVTIGVNAYVPVGTTEEEE